jgi:hypothetical protein
MTQSSNIPAFVWRDSAKARKPPSVKTAGVQAKVELEHFPNTRTSVGRYDFAQLLRGLHAV